MSPFAGAPVCGLWPHPRQRGADLKRGRPVGIHRRPGRAAAAAAAQWRPGDWRRSTATAAVPGVCRPRPRHAVDGAHRMSYLERCHKPFFRPGSSPAFPETCDSAKESAESACTTEAFAQPASGRFGWFCLTGQWRLSISGRSGKSRSVVAIALHELWQRGSCRSRILEGQSSSAC